MKRSLLQLVLIAAVAASAFGQPANTNSTDKAAEAEIRNKLNQDVQRALSNNVESTIADFERNYHKDYISVTTNGRVYTLSDILKGIKQTKSIPKFSSLKIDDVQIRLHGDTAVATYIRSHAMESEPKSAARDVRVTAVFIRRNGEWLRIFDQRSNMQTQN